MRHTLCLTVLLLAGCAARHPANFNSKTHALGPTSGPKVVHFGATW